MSITSIVDVGVFYFVGKWLWQPVIRPFLIILGLLFVFAVIFGEFGEAMKPHLPQSAVPVEQISFSMYKGEWRLENRGNHAIGQVEITCHERNSDDNEYFVTERLNAHSESQGFLNEMRDNCDITDYKVYAN